MIQDIQNEIHNRFNTIQRLYRIAYSAEFEEAYAKATDKQREDFKYYFNQGYHELIRRLMNKIMLNDISGLPLLELKRKAKKLGIPQWYKMDKDEIVEALKNAQRNSEAARRATTEDTESSLQQKEVQTNRIST